MKGKIVLYSSLIITLLLWISNYNFGSNILLTISRVTALIGVVLISWEFILSSRSSIVEELFDGLDKVYTFHHNVGRWGFIAILIHPFMLITNAIIKDINPLLYILPIGPISYSVGVFSLYLFVILLIVTIFLKIEYHLWKLTHNLMGIPLLFLLLHVLLISSDITTNIPLRILIIGFVLAANIFFIYKRVFYQLFKGYEYKVVGLKEHGSSMEIILKPKENNIEYEPTQFVFIQAINSQVTKEMHPFTIASQNDDRSISLIVKKLGDYTENINKLRINDTVKIYGPHGRFYTHFKADNQVWVAGGIGITPFLAKLQEVSKQKDINTKKITLYYIAKTEDDFIYTDRLLQYKEMINNFSLILHDTSKLGRIDPKVIIPNENSSYLICASEQLTNSFTKVLKEQGIKRKNINTELFKLY